MESAEGVGNLYRLSFVLLDSWLCQRLIGVCGLTLPFGFADNVRR